MVVSMDQDKMEECEMGDSEGSNEGEGALGTKIFTPADLQGKNFFTFWTPFVNTFILIVVFYLAFVDSETYTSFLNFIIALSESVRGTPMSTDCFVSTVSFYYCYYSYELVTCVGFSRVLFGFLSHLLVLFFFLLVGGEDDRSRRDDNELGQRHTTTRGSNESFSSLTTT